MFAQTTIKMFGAFLSFYSTTFFSNKKGNTAFAYTYEVAYQTTVQNADSDNYTSWQAAGSRYSMQKLKMQVVKIS